MDSSTQIEQRAAAWLAKRDSGEWTQVDEHQLNEWLDAATANTVAFIRLEAAWNSALRLRALAAGTPRGVVPPPDAWHLSPFFEQDSAPVRDSRTDPFLARVETEARDLVRPLVESKSAESKVKRRESQHAWLPRALVATMLMGIMSSVAYYFLTLGPTYRTPIGGLASVPMTDGSKVTLNTDSAIRVDVSGKERRVRLDHGEAFFEVAKDPTRPFVVSVGSKRVIAVGTQFSVRRISNDIRVFVIEGKVRFEDDSMSSGKPHAGSSAQAGIQGEQHSSSDSGAVFLTAGSIARTGDTGVLVQEQSLREVEDYLSWRSGYLVFRDTAVADAVAEFNRYNVHKIVIQDHQVATIKLSGKFRSTNFEAFARLLEDGFPINARHVDQQIVLTDRK
jgi:transmembrane sensor